MRGETILFWLSFFQKEKASPKKERETPMFVLYKTVL